MKVSRYATLGLAVFAMILGILFEKQNVAFMVGLAFSVAACANFLYWSSLCSGKV